MSQSTPRTDRKTLFDGETAIRMPLDADLLAKIPARRGVFFLEGPERAPVLLATAANIRARMRGRLTDPGGPTRRADLREVARCLRWKLTDSHFETDWRYLRLARRIYPGRYREMVGFRPAWFVHVDPDDRAPCFHGTRDVFSAAGRYFGPFPDGRSAGRFIDTLQDVFDLCRHEQVLRQAPNGRPCVYAQMGRCRTPCDGSMSMAEYRQLVGRACRCIEGGRQDVRDSLEARMRRLAGERRYEQAAICKARLDRLAALEGSQYRFVAPAERFQYVLVQRGSRAGQAKTFLVDRGFVRQGATLTYPLQARRLEALLGRVRKWASSARAVGQPQRECMGLLARYLFSSDARKGVIVRSSKAVTAEMLAEAIEAQAEALRLRRPARPARPAAKST